MENKEIVIPEEEKGYKCQIILDSVNPVGCRLTTFRLKYPLIIHGEMTRHRAHSRSVASNRAIPTARIIAMVEQDPFTPVWWGKNQSGMQANEELEGKTLEAAQTRWEMAREDAIRHAKRLVEIGLHKQLANRILSPFQWVTEIITGTDYANFFALRCHPAAQPEIRTIAEMMREEYDKSKPILKQEGEWHIPFIQNEEKNNTIDTQLRMSAARCARTSYRTHEGKISTLEEDDILFQRLVGNNPKHSSPCEHQAFARRDAKYNANFRGWYQHRHLLDDHTVWDEPYGISNI